MLQVSCSTGVYAPGVMLQVGVYAPRVSMLHGCLCSTISMLHDRCLCSTIGVFAPRSRNTSTGEAAAVMNVPARTLSSWCRAWELDGLEARPRGRPAVEVLVEQCGAVRNFLESRGPIVGLPTLRSHHAHIPRVVLGEILGAFRDSWRDAHRRVICDLEWARPGAIWAIDFTHPPRLVDGVFPSILNVVDLGSRQQLLWLATSGEDAGTVRDALRDLFEQYGAPLAIKSDNGPAFCAEATKELLSDWSVFPLYSPPYCALQRRVRTRQPHHEEEAIYSNHLTPRSRQELWWGHTARAVAKVAPSRPLGGRGPISGRQFDPAAAGGPIRQLTTGRIKITNQGIDVVEQHVGRFGPDAANQGMIQRLRDIAAGKLQPTQADLNYYSHELREFVRYRQLGWQTGKPADLDAAHELWNNAHTATLEDYGLRDGTGVLYHPSVEP